jgi:flagellar biosynthesis protein FlhB
MRPTMVVTNIPRMMRSLSVEFNRTRASAGLVVVANTNCIALRVCAIKSEAEIPLPDTSPIAKYVSYGLRTKTL